MYDVNTKDTRTTGDYKSGRGIPFDYALGYHLGKYGFWGPAAIIIIRRRMMNSTGHSVDGFKGRVFAIGPAVEYSYKKMSFTVEIPEGDGGRKTGPKATNTGSNSVTFFNGSPANQIFVACSIDFFTPQHFDYDDCDVVKLGLASREGMTLSRIFSMMTDEGR